MSVRNTQNINTVLFSLYKSTQPNTRIKIVSESMLPGICKGDYIRVNPPTGRTWPGTILLCRGQKHLYAHRLILAWRGKWYLKGDSTKDGDPPIHKDDILGYVTRIENNKGRWKPDFMKYPALIHGLLLLVGAKIKNSMYSKIRK